MTPRYKQVLLLSCGLALAGVALVMGLRMSVHKDSPAPAEPIAARPPAAAQTSPAAAAEPPPPWAATPRAAMPAAARAAMHMPAAMQSISPAQSAQTLTRIRAQANQNLVTLDNLVKQLDQTQAQHPDKAKEMNLAAVRDNLLVARRAQVLALELAETTQLPESPQKTTRQDQIVQELQSLQARIHSGLVQPQTQANGKP